MPAFLGTSFKVFTSDNEKRSLLYLMLAIAGTRGSTHATDLMRVKKARTTSVYDTYF